MDILGALGQLLSAFSRAMQEALTWWLTTLSTLLTTTVVPSILVFRLDWFRTQIGSVVGLAQAILIPVAVIITFIVVINFPAARRDSGTGRLFSSIGMMSLFVIGFYPVCDFALSLSAAARDFFIKVISGMETPELNTAINNALSFIPGANSVFPIVLLVAVILSIVVWFVALGILFLTFVIALVYPIIIALRPLGGVFDKLFHAANAGVVVVLLAPPLMSMAVMLPVLVGKIPYLGMIGGQFAAVFIGLGAAIYIPFGLGSLVYTKSNKMFGSVEARISSVSELKWQPRPPAGQDGTGKPSSIHAFSTSLATGAASVALTSRSPEQFRSKLKHVAADAAAAGLLAGGQPVVAALIQAADTSSRVREEDQKKKAHATAAAQAAAAATAAALTAPPVQSAPPPPPLPPFRPPNP